MPRSVLSAIANAIDQSDHWLPKLRPLIDAPAAFKEAGPKLLEALDLLGTAHKCVDAAALQTLDKVTKTFAELKGMVGESAMSTHLENLWCRIAEFWAGYKA